MLGNNDLQFLYSALSLNGLEELHILLPQHNCTHQYLNSSTEIHATRGHTRSMYNICPCVIPGCHWCLSEPEYVYTHITLLNIFTMSNGKCFLSDHRKLTSWQRHPSTLSHYLAHYWTAKDKQTYSKAPGIGQGHKNFSSPSRLT